MKKWWMEATGYQIYLKSFKDSNDDGIGDLLGLYEKLDYLHLLGIDLIWISPFFVSPMDDNGYDIANHFDVDPIYGSLDDFKLVMTKAKSLGIRVILDYVLNHTSDEHEWFINAKESTNNKYRNYYIWQKPRIIDKQMYPPTNWASFFGGSAWQYDEKSNMYYMKIFSNKMPDLNWKNPDVISQMIKVGKYWLDLGVDGFRIDAISHLGRKEFVDSPLGKASDVVLDASQFSNLPEVYDYIKILKEELFTSDLLTIGEMGGNATKDYALAFTNLDNPLISMVFNFDHNWCNNIHHISHLDELKINSKLLKETLSKWQYFYLSNGWLPLNWLNHDQPRLASHYGSKKYPFLSQSMLATLNYLQRGTPFIYQGEEIGMTNYDFKNIEEFRDVSSINFYQFLKSEGKLNESDMIFQVSKTSRDQARLPMQWDNSKYAGFSNQKPWLLVNPNKDSINVYMQMEDENSIWHYYRKLIKLRKTLEYKDVLIYGSYEMLLTSDSIYAYLRTNSNKSVLIITSFLEDTTTFDISGYKINKILISNNQKPIIIENKILTLWPYAALVLDVTRRKLQ